MCVGQCLLGIKPEHSTSKTQNKVLLIASLFYLVNFALLMSGFVIATFLVGPDKFVMTDRRTKMYETNRRARRMFIPYSLVGYRWRFPANK